MNVRRRLQRLAAIALVAASSAVLSCSASTALPLVAPVDLPLPGNATRLDYQSVDPRRHLLFVAHLGDSVVVAVDTKSRRVVATIPNVSSVHGVLAVPELGTAYASATGTNQIVAIDESSFKITARAEGGVYPDGIAFDPITRRISVSDEHGQTDTVIDTRTNRRIATIPLGGDVGNTQYDPASTHIFVNVQTLGQLVEIDPVKNIVLKRFPLSGTPCVGNHGLLIDAQKRRAFIACEDSNTFLWVDMRTMHTVKDWPIGEGPDVLALDPDTHRLFVASESGTVSAFNDGDRVTRIAQSFLAPAADPTQGAQDETSMVISFCNGLCVRCIHFGLRRRKN